jgi:hypothetical protein
MNIPDNEILWVQYKDIDGTLTHIITSNVFRTEYYLYKVTNDKPKKTKYVSDNPLDLDNYTKRRSK